MPLPIELDTRHWVRFQPTGASEIVKVLGNACYHSSEAAPPELEFPGKPVSAGSTELAVNGEVTVEGPKWFLNKMTSQERKGEEAFKPALLETFPVVLEGIGTTEILNEAVTAAKIAKEAVTEAKYAKESVPATAVKVATLPAIAAEKAVKVGTVLGVDKVVMCNLAGDGTSAQSFKVKHTLETFNIALSFWTNVSSKPGVQITAAAALPTVTINNAKEFTLLFAGTEPAAGATGIIWIKVEGS